MYVSGLDFCVRQSAGWVDGGGLLRDAALYVDTVHSSRHVTVGFTSHRTTAGTFTTSEKAHTPHWCVVVVFVLRGAC